MIHLKVETSRSIKETGILTIKFRNRKKSRQVEFVAGTVGYLSSSSSKNTLFDSKSKRMIKDNEMRHIKYHEGIEKSQNSTHSQSKIKIIIQSEDSTAVR